MSDDVFGLYEATINLNSRGLNQVFRSDLTAPELAILRKVHSEPNEFLGGIDPVTGVKRIGEVERSEAEERARLGGVEIDGVIPVFAKKKFELAFPGEHIPLPREVSGHEPKTASRSTVPVNKRKDKPEDIADIMGD